MKPEITLFFLISISLCLQPNDYMATITFDTNSTSFIGSGVSIKDNQATIISEGSYLIKGKSPEGNIIVSKSSVNLYLQNLNLTSNITSPIIINSKLSNITITSLENVILTDNESPNTTSGECAVIKVKKNSVATIENQKDFTLIGSCKNVIKGGTQTSIKFGSSNGEYIIHGYQNGISSDHYLEFNGGKFNIKTDTGDGIKSSPDNTDNHSEGKIVINNGEFIIESYEDAFKAKKIININGGNFKIKTENGYDSKTFDDETMTAKGFKISNNETGCEMVIKGGNFYLNTPDSSFHSKGNMTITDGIFEIYSGKKGIHSGFNLTIGEKDIKKGPTINILASFEGIEARYITIYYANIDLKASDDGMNAAAGNKVPGVINDYFISIYDGKIYVLCSGDGIDSNGDVNIYGGETKVISEGYKEGQDNEPIDYDLSFNLIKGEVFLGGNKGNKDYTHKRITKGSQNYAYYANIVEENTIIKIKNEKGIEIKKVTIPKQLSYLFYTSLELNEKFKFYLSDSTGGNEKEMSFKFGTTGGGEGGEGDGNFIDVKKIIYGLFILLIP